MSGERSSCARPDLDGTRVHVVYVRHTVELLLPFLATLLEHTDWDLTLVANACTDDEVALLEGARAAHPDRVRTWIESADTPVGHGEMLDRLLRAETSPYFCYVDSDILARGPVRLAELLPAPDEAATCACLPFWLPARDTTMPDHFEIALGHYLRTEGGQFLGCTYAAFYRTAELRPLVEERGISLSQANWEELPVDVRDELDRRGIRLRVYDTAKVANILLQTSDRPMVYRRTPNLLHVGAQSGRAGQDASLRLKLRERVRFFTPPLYALLWRARGYGGEESSRLADEGRRRRQLARVIEQIVSGRSPVGDPPEWLSERDRHALETVFARPDPTVPSSPG